MAKILQQENRRVESPIPRVMWKNIKLLKKFPGITKAIRLRVYRDEETDWKVYKFVFAEDVRQDFIDYFNNLYQQEWEKYQESWVKFIGKELDKQREKETNETTK